MILYKRSGSRDYYMSRFTWRNWMKTQIHFKGNDIRIAIPWSAEKNCHHLHLIIDVWGAVVLKSALMKDRRMI